MSQAGAKVEKVESESTLSIFPFFQHHALYKGGDNSCNRADTSSGSDNSTGSTSGTKDPIRRSASAPPVLNHQQTVTPITVNQSQSLPSLGQ